MRHFGVRVTDRFRLDTLRTVILENELLRVTFLVDQGCDIIELLYKPKDVDFLWRSPQGVRRRDHFIAYLTHATAVSSTTTKGAGRSCSLTPAGLPNTQMRSWDSTARCGAFHGITRS